MSDPIEAVFERFLAAVNAKTPTEAAWDDARSHLTVVEAKIGRWCAAYGKGPSDELLAELREAQAAERAAWNDYYEGIRA